MLQYNQNCAPSDLWTKQVQYQLSLLLGSKQLWVAFTSSSSNKLGHAFRGLPANHYDVLDPECLRTMGRRYQLPEGKAGNGGKTVAPKDY
jgi:hypothetical protein